MSFRRELLPNAIDFYRDIAGLDLKGHGPWRTTSCVFHGGSDSMRVNIRSGGFVCMAQCGARGGDIVDYHRAANGLRFTEAAKALGAFEGNLYLKSLSDKPRRLPAADLLRVVAFELQICVMLLSDGLAGRLTDVGFTELLEAVNVVNYVTEVANDA